MVDLTQYLWIIWLVFVVVCVIIEVLTLEFTFMMVAAGSLIGGLGANLLGAEWWVQILAAAVISGLLLFTIRPLLLKTLDRGVEPARTNVDALMGMTARVTAAFADGAGYVKLANGETWTARLAPQHETLALAEGDRVVVTRIDGATAEVAPAERSEAP
ncbi:NfeD family protein [Microcella humidisoli]|uniref:NfeD family protein n=1 Tax=Microcella humidisoli TaxID=2963406 RepID=A0ABY5FVA5_9MICO|nr:NfeD family protein [Microcella humidisoli]UTT62244.1 NfeD family protein [Microcella humidisoli]